MQNEGDITGVSRLASQFIGQKVKIHWFQGAKDRENQGELESMDAEWLYLQLPSKRTNVDHLCIRLDAVAAIESEE